MGGAGFPRQIDEECVALLDAIEDDFASNEPRRRFAEYLDRHGQTAWAEVVRLQCTVFEPQTDPEQDKGALYKRSHELLEEGWAEPFRVWGAQRWHRGLPLIRDGAALGPWAARSRGSGSPMRERTPGHWPPARTWEGSRTSTSRRWISGTPRSPTSRRRRTWVVFARST